MKKNKTCSIYEKDNYLREIQHEKGSYLREEQRCTKFAPRLSPKGPYIRASEPLARHIFYPDHASRDGTIKVEAISRDDLLKRGFSLHRVNYTSLDNFSASVQVQIDRNQDRQLVGVTKFSAEDVRNINTLDHKQAFVVIDDAPEPNLKGHAIVLCANNKWKPSQVKELRSLLAEILFPVCEPSTIFR